MLASCRRCLYISARQLGTKPKIVGKLEDSVLQAIENNQIKPKQHPGRIKNQTYEIPKRLQKAILTVLKDQPFQVLCTEGDSLDRYLKGRHPPISPDEQKQVKGSKHYAWKPIEYEARTCQQYLVGRVAADFSILSRVFAEMTTRVPDFKPKTVFDFGSGIGTVAWAAHAAWEDSLKEIYCVDASSDMNNLAELLLRGGQPEGATPVQGTFFRQFLPASQTRQYDIVVSSFSLFELSSTEARLSTLHNLWSKTQHYLVLVEQGTNAGFKLIDEAKEFILYLSKSTQSAHTFAPCPHDLACPRLQLQDGTPCNFDVGYLPLLGRGGQPRRERFCYVVLGKGQRPESLPPWPRVVRPTLAKSRHTICRLCTSAGKLEQVILTASKDGRASYKCARASEWGDLLPISIATTTFESPPEPADVPGEPNLEKL